ncbi:MAG TPA: type II toxin-antitoxin system VapC family toxin [Candidatus Acidoferrum sp.]|nr:type II toxin-antitoxin system VapC family toxin [Candidatus Acidoferrum sp.]
MILDTNALSAAADLEPDAIKILAAVDRLFLPVVVLGEYRVGIAQSRHRAAYESWLQEWTAAVSVLKVDEGTTFAYAEIALELRRKGKPIPANDLWIAALCRQHGLPLLSRDHHFDVVSGLHRVEW